jgi:hypothetical protein
MKNNRQPSIVSIAYEAQRDFQFRIQSSINKPEKTLLFLKSQISFAGDY